MTERERLPTRRASIAFQSDAFYVTISQFSDGRIVEIFLDHSRPNSQIAELSADCAVLASLLFQHGVSVAEIRHSISGPLAVALDIAEGAS